MFATKQTEILSLRTERKKAKNDSGFFLEKEATRFPFQFDLKKNFFCETVAP
jgi:hypothetical protein